MDLPELRGWPRTVASARKIQQRLADSVIRTGVPENIKFVAGVDVGFGGMQDYYGNAVGNPPSIGAHELSSGMLARNRRFKSAYRTHLMGM